MNIFSSLDYRSSLCDYVEYRKKLDPTCSYQNMALETKIPKSYISKVKSKVVHLNQDQLFKICQFLKIKAPEQEFLSLLLEHERSTLQARKKILKKAIDEIRRKELRSEKFLDGQKEQQQESMVQAYYMDALNPLVHIALSVPKYQNNPEAIAQDFLLPKAVVFKTIAHLTELGIIEVSKDGYRTKVKSIHLAKDMPIFKSWRTQLRSRCQERLNSAPAPEDYSFSVTFSATQEVRQNIQAAFFAFLKQVESGVRDAENKEVFQMNFDLFSWCSQA